MQYRSTFRQAYGLTLDMTAPPMVRSFLSVGLALVVFGLFLLIVGRDPIDSLVTVFRGTLGSKVGMSEVSVRMVPLVLTALATAIPARVGLINVGGEGQLYIGAWAATGVALHLGTGQTWLMLPLMAAAGLVGGGLWAGGAVLLRNWRGVNEVITTLLSNYVAILFVNVFVFGAWKNSDGFGYPYTSDFESAAILSAIGVTRLHLGLIMPVLAVAACYLVFARTRWGFNMRAVGGNAEAARRRGIPVGKYLIVAMIVGGALAGLAGMGEVSGIQHHLRPGISHNLGFLGFLASWLAGHNPITIVAACFLLALIFVGGDVLQLSGGLPSSASLILVGLVLFFVLGFRRSERSTA